MKSFLALLLLSLAAHASAQMLPSHAEVLKAVYGSGFDAALIDGVRNCPVDSGPDHDRCMALPNARAGLKVLKEIRADESPEIRTYALTEIVSEHDCHACAPQLGMAIFVWRKAHWQLERERPDASFLGTFGAAPTAKFVRIGPRAHGFLLTLGTLGQGYEETMASLLAPSGPSIETVWQGILYQHLEQEDAVDKSVRDIPNMNASIHFAPLRNSDHYQLIVAMHGRGYDPSNRTSEVRPLNRTDIFRFANGKYQLLNRQADR
jgi:hypothetical protein